MNRKATASVFFIFMFFLGFGLTKQVWGLTGSGKVKIIVNYKGEANAKVFNKVKRITMYHEGNKIVLIKLRDGNNKNILINFYNIAFFEYDLDDAIPVVVKKTSELIELESTK